MPYKIAFPVVMAGLYGVAKAEEESILDSAVVSSYDIYTPWVGTT